MNPFYMTKKLVSANLRNFEKIEKRVGKHFLIAQINGRMLLVLKTFYRLVYTLGMTSMLTVKMVILALVILGK